jgi:hypothetical protein
LKIPALPPLDFSQDDSNNDAAVDNANEEIPEVGESGCWCNYPVCLFGSGGPPLDTCQGTRGKKYGFHHVCNINWLESYSKDAELRKLCYICVQSL